MATETFPEHFGAFKLYGSDEKGWTLSWSSQWLPGAYEDKKALFLIIGLFLAESNTGLIDELMEMLQERCNRAVPSRTITAEDILRTYSPSS